jgi:hypothetical protein
VERLKQRIEKMQQQLDDHENDAASRIGKLEGAMQELSVALHQMWAAMMGRK